MVDVSDLEDRSPLYLVCQLIRLTNSNVLNGRLESVYRVLMRERTIVCLRSTVILPLIEVTSLSSRILRLILDLYLNDDARPNDLISTL